MHSNGLVGPYFFTGNVNQHSYMDLLSDFAIPSLMTLPNWGDIIWQQDGAPAHWATRVRAYLDEIFGMNWIGRDGPIRWPARSPDLTPLDFFVWGHLKDKVYRTRPQTLDALRNEIIQECAGINARMSTNACRSVSTRLEICVERDGSQVSTTKYR